MDAATMENSMEVPQKTKNRTYNLAISILGIYMKEKQSTTKNLGAINNWKENCCALSEGH